MYIYVVLLLSSFNMIFYYPYRIQLHYIFKVNDATIGVAPITGTRTCIMKFVHIKKKSHYVIKVFSIPSGKE